MRIVFAGSGSFGCDCLEWLDQSGNQVVEIITQPARPAGRGQEKRPTPIAELAARLNLPCRETPDINTPETIEHISRLQPQILLVIAFGQKIPSELLGLPDCRVINLHASLLPKYRGAAPINWAIINGEKQTGLTIIELNEVWDGGDILGQMSTDIEPNETTGELHDRLARMGPELLAEVLNKISEKTDQALVQDKTLASRAPKLKKSDGAIDWRKSARQICNHICGMTPWPGAYCQLLQQSSSKIIRLNITRAQLQDEPSESMRDLENAEPGDLLDDMSVVCGSGRVKLLEVKPENGRGMSFDDFANGRHLTPGDKFQNG
jgi:methionyl-tRNA formyltransferase